MRDPYESLAVPRWATAADIKKSFRQQAKRLHPDANNDPKAAALFAELCAAHDILGDEEKRRAFDRGDIDAEGKLAPEAIARRSMPSMSHVVTRLMVVMVMLFITATLIMRSLTRGENTNADSAGRDRVSSGVNANEEHAATAQPEQPKVLSEPRLILQQTGSYAAADSIPLGIEISGEAVDLVVEISGLPSGTTITSGRDLGGGEWRIFATDVGNATIHPPAGFSGTLDLGIELRHIDDTVVDRGSLRLEWLHKPTTAPEPIVSAGAAGPESSALAAAAPADQNVIQAGTDLQRDNEPVDLLIGRSEKLIAEGNAEAARLLLQPAAEAHDARAALALGATYDPIMLALLQGHGISADVFLALDWYKRAQEFGSYEAQSRLKLLSATVAEPKKHALHHPIRLYAPKRSEASSQDRYGVYVASERAGSDPEPSIRVQLARDNASRKLPTLWGIGY
jgi:hypothetical protein